ncbi:HhH-GPD family base excision DNA repair protein [Penicillium manginii]|uniref:HhH-GPD family base excision DNA repair protein n=1 Tax=Penicillium manginii TaxID=203109 RepID=UPI002548C8F4|nr:HhH-GPD family base excision DNA repair protein [Penicillium manginii]KAJ5734602.1 HhH-GPD family base excision DNA repair protein [Penicillium manginii]
MAPTKPVRQSTSDPKTRKQDGKKANKARASTTRNNAKSKPNTRISKATGTQKKGPIKEKAKINVKKEKDSESPQPNSSALLPPATDELPHNLAPLTSTPTLNLLQPHTPSPNDTKSTLVTEELQVDLPPTTATNQPQSPIPEIKPKTTGKTRPKPKLQITLGKTPFPSWNHPTPSQCEEINQLLSYAHGEPIAPKTIPRPSIEFAGCGEVPCVPRRADKNSPQRRNEGIGKGGVNWEAVRQAPLREVFSTIQRGGLADIKSRNLKAILDMVYEENRARYGMEGEQQGKKNELISNDTATLTEELSPETEIKAETEAEAETQKSTPDKEKEHELASQNLLSLNHLHNLPTEEVMTELTKYPGIGVKTAACVLLFCLQRPCFAVDTHIFRITKWLGWVPADLATEVTAFRHLDARIPDHLKYSLHQLLIKHGKLCPRCRAITSESSEGWGLGCPIDEFLTRTGARKGGPVIVARRAKRTSRKTTAKKATERKVATQKKTTGV